MQGVDFGGTAFLVGYPSRHEGKLFTYAVTNWHVACRDGASCLRVNRRDGGSDIFPFGPEQWEFDPKYDIAVRLVSLDSSVHKYRSISVKDFATQEKIGEWNLGVGEDVFMVGRFVDHDGGPVNMPALRFGHISLMPSAMEQPNGVMADAYCVDLHSRTGYSGSPVMAYRTVGGNIASPKEPGNFNLIDFLNDRFVTLLGIHFGQFPEEWELREGAKPKVITPHGVPLITEGKYVKGLSGMTCVLPSWSIRAVLDMPLLVEQRTRIDDMLEARLKKEGKVSPVSEASAPPATDENPNHREDFTNLLGAAAKTLPSKD